MTKFQQGNSLLEFILYLPAAALILFASSDIGFRWSETSAFSSMFRSSARQAQMKLGELRGLNETETIHSKNAELIAENIFRHLSTSIEEYKRRSIRSSTSDFSLLVQVIQFEADVQSGFIDRNSMRVLAKRGRVESSNWRERIDNQLARVSLQSAAPRTSLLEKEGYVSSYLATYSFIYSRVSTESSSLSRRFISSVFEGPSVVEEEIIFSLQ